VKKYTVSMVRERLAQALDEAQRGEPVFIERGDVLYRLSVERGRKTRPRKPSIEILDPAVERGDWTWTWSPGRLAFKGRRRK
jgi:antitoxin (DNA-binding transcriptional repressor) of toxin-antitoxin stability system